VDLGSAVDKLYGPPRERFLVEREKLAKVEARAEARREVDLKLRGR
jgi:hypothetical protein